MSKPAPTAEPPLKIAVKYAFIGFFATFVGGFILSKLLLGADSDRGGYITAKMVPYVTLGAALLGYLVQELRNRRLKRAMRAEEDDGQRSDDG